MYEDHPLPESKDDSCNEEAALGQVQISTQLQMHFIIFFPGRNVYAGSWIFNRPYYSVACKAASLKVVLDLAEAKIGP